jgi:hypothetical protein
MNALRHEVVTLVAQRADKLGGERVVEQLQHDFAIRGVARCDGPLVHVLARLLADLLQVEHERVCGFRHSGRSSLRLGLSGFCRVNA